MTYLCISFMNLQSDFDQVNAHTIVARVFANIAIWGILVFGAFFVYTFKDYTIGFELAILSLCKWLL